MWLTHVGLLIFLWVVDDVAFGRMGMRLAERLLILVGDVNDIKQCIKCLPEN